MSVVIRLMRAGAKKRPFYRMVAADSRRQRDGRFLEILGHYNPLTQPYELVVHKDRVENWLSQGRPAFRAGGVAAALARHPAPSRAGRRSRTARRPKPAAKRRRRRPQARASRASSRHARSKKRQAREGGEGEEGGPRRREPRRLRPPAALGDRAGVSLVSLPWVCGRDRGADRARPRQRAARAQALIEAGNQAYRTGDYRLAARRYAAAAVLDKDDPAAYFGMGMALQKLGRDEEARAAYTPRPGAGASSSADPWRPRPRAPSSNRSLLEARRCTISSSCARIASGWKPASP